VATFGLTGGIGSGKSTVASMLAARGVRIIDADAITRDLQRNGEPGFRAIVERFGETVVGPDGELDRAGLADVVFSDAGAKADLEAIIHPLVGAEIARRLGERQFDELVILDIPLLVETGRDGLDGVIVVDADPGSALHRLVTERGMRAEDVRARMAAQASREERLGRADFVVSNDGSLRALEAEVDRCLAWMRSVAATAAGPAAGDG
jgi:dephospho-CoA kinase